MKRPDGFNECGREWYKNFNNRVIFAYQTYIFMKLIFSVILFLISMLSCNTQDRSAKTLSKDCFSAESFFMLTEYISDRIKFSGSGKFYIEYPPDKTQFDDGIKRPSKHPENVFEVRNDETLDKIILESKSLEISFLSKTGLVLKKDHTPADHATANDIYCYLLGMASKK